MLISTCLTSSGAAIVGYTNGSKNLSQKTLDQTPKAYYESPLSAEKMGSAWDALA